jgi:hypothetical protein
LTGAAVNVTLPPRQIDVVVDVMVTDGVTLVAVTVIVLLVAVGEVVQAALLVMITLTWSLLARVVVVNVAAVCPGTAIPLICHT